MYEKEKLPLPETWCPYKRSNRSNIANTEVEKEALVSSDTLGKCPRRFHSHVLKTIIPHLTMK